MKLISTRILTLSVVLFSILCPLLTHNYNDQAICIMNGEKVLEL